MKRILLVLIGALMTLLWVGTVLADGNRFVVSGKTVEDTHTCLTWTRDAHLAKLNWSGATDLVKQMNEEGYADVKNWRLPSREELMTLADYAMRAGYIGGTYFAPPYELFNKTGFHGVQSNFYWSSSSYEDNPAYADVINMCNGVPRSENKEKEFYVWPVHGVKLGEQSPESK